MLRPVRVAGGLGDPPSEFCTNDSEAINSAIKQSLHFKKSDWPVFNDKMKKFVTEQQEEVCKAIVGLGEYRNIRISDEYQSLAIPPSHWFTALNDEQRNNARRKFQETCVLSVHTPASDVIQEPDKGSVSASDEDTTVDITSTQNLSVDVETVSLNTGIPTLVLRQMWAKVIELLNTNQVLPAPGCATSSRMVASASKKSLILLVQKMVVLNVMMIVLTSYNTTSVHTA